jgi:hypothetical protein
VSVSVYELNAPGRDLNQLRFVWQESLLINEFREGIKQLTFAPFLELLKLQRL